VARNEVNSSAEAEATFFGAIDCRESEKVDAALAARLEAELFG